MSWLPLFTALTKLTALFQLTVPSPLASGSKPEDLKTGCEVELVVEPLYDQDDTTYTVWKWKPVAA